MKPALLLLLVLALCGCQSRRRISPETALLLQQQQALMMQQHPVVTFWGEVKNPTVEWKEGLTLADALLEAQYQGLWDPHAIYIIRKGEKYYVDPKKLLRGQEDPELAAGDLIQLER